MEDQTDEGDADIKKNFMVHKIKSLLAEKWDLECEADLKHVFRFSFHMHLRDHEACPHVLKVDGWTSCEQCGAHHGGVRGQG